MKLKQKLHILSMLMRAHNAAHHFRHSISGKKMWHRKHSIQNMALFSIAIFAHAIATFAIGTMAIGSVACGNLFFKERENQSIKN